MSIEEYWMRKAKKNEEEILRLQGDLLRAYLRIGELEKRSRTAVTVDGA